jgi:hypothetical protein
MSIKAKEFTELPQKILKPKSKRREKRFLHYKNGKRSFLINKDWFARHTHYRGPELTNTPFKCCVCEDSEQPPTPAPTQGRAISAGTRVEADPTELWPGTAYTMLLQACCTP